jgi:hypothetical protein
MKVIWILVRTVLALLGPAIACNAIWGGWAALLCFGLQCFWLSFTPSEWSTS